MEKYNLEVCNKRTDIKYFLKEVSLDEFITRLNNPKEINITKNEYLKLDKEKQADLKDVGGYVAGVLKDNERKKDNVISRSFITLDIDNNLTREEIENIKDNAFIEGFELLIHTTFKSSKESPRVRIIIPLSRNVDKVEYEFLARYVANLLTDINIFDSTTFQANRMMYWPAKMKNEEYKFFEEKGDILEVDRILKDNPNYLDSSTWIYQDEEEKVSQKETTGKVVRGDSKNGVVGAFCKVFSLEEAIDKFLSDIYKKGTIKGRYTYLLGSAANGLRIYKDTDTCYCEDDTDPANVGTSLNAFDLVRIHKFGEFDKGHENEEITSLPSYKKMVERAKMYKKVREILEEESKSELFDGIENNLIGEEVSENDKDTSWLNKLKTYQTRNGSQIAEISENFDLIFENDSKLKGLVGTDETNGFITFKRDPYWKRSGDNWSDTDNAFLVAHFDTVYHLTNRTMINEALVRYSKKNSYNPIRDFIESVKWDGVKRVETLFIDYNGAEDNLYTRVISKKILEAAVARIFHPGCKWDYMPILVGDQGCGKSYILYLLAGGLTNGGKWFQDAVPDFKSKSAYEAVDGKWIVEIGELAGFNYSDMETVKLFLSKSEDVYRKAYAKFPGFYPRTCIFVGTSNADNFLRDSTGERRFFPITCSSSRIKKSLIKEFTKEEVNQVWAEALELYKSDNEPLTYFPKEIDGYVEEARKYYANEDPRESDVESFLSLELPESYFDLDIKERRVFLANLKNTEGASKKDSVKNFDPFDDLDDLEIKEKMIVRDRVCPKEILCELFGYDSENIKKIDFYDVTRILRKLGWKKEDKRVVDKEYGKQYFWTKELLDQLF